MSGTKKSSTMRQVAQHANMSIATVSRALRDPDSVSKKALARVEEAAAAIGYTYNASAGDVLAGRSTVLGVLVPSVSSTLFGQMLHALQDAALDAKFSIIQGVTDWERGKEEKLLETMVNRRVHGLILPGVTDAMHDRFVEIVTEAGIRTVVIWEKPRDDELSYVGIDNFGAARDATCFLIDQGHKRIGLLAGPVSITTRTRHRFEGYCAALQERGLDYDPDIVLERLPDLNNGREAMISVMSSPNPPTAVFAASDILAIGALRGAHEMGLAVPGDVSILGFDNLDIAAFQHPPITTMNVPGYQIGELAAQIAIEDQGLPPRKFCLDSDLVLRKSTGQPKA